MKRLVLAFAIVATLAVALLVTGHVFAQGANPPTPPAPGTGYRGGRGGMGGGMGGGMMGRGAGGNVGDGILHDAMMTVFSQKLGISVTDLETRLTKGETMAQIASAKGLTAEQFTTLMKDARTQAIDQAVKDGTLTQAQADWMKTRGFGMNGQGAGRGMGRGMNGTNCPYFNQTNP